MKISYLLGLMLTLLFGVNAYAGDIFTIGKVHVDATAESALEAQTKAIRAGQVEAANRLIERLTLASDRVSSGFSGVAPDDGAKMIRALSIANEKRSGRRYLGDITVSFNNRAVEQYLRSRGLNMIKTQASPRLVIPVLEGHGLWEANEWAEVWQNADLGNALTPFKTITPNMDIYALASDLSELDMDKLKKIGQITGVQHILLARAKPDGAGGYIVSLKDIALDSGTTRQLAPVRGLSAKDAMHKIVAHIEDDWKRSMASTISTTTQILPVIVLFKTQSEWVNLQKALDGAQQIRSTELKTLSNHGAEMLIGYGGDLERLRSELSYKGLSLRQDEELGIVLARSGAF